jgi:hypothetical protein
VDTQKEAHHISSVCWTITKRRAMKKFSERSPLLSPQRKVTSEEEDVWLEDAVTVGLRRMCAAWSFMIIMWYLSFVVKVGEILFKHHIHVSKITTISVVFIPM